VFVGEQGKRRFDGIEVRASAGLMSVSVGRGMVEKPRVERMFLDSWSKWPSVVAMDLGKCLDINCVVSHGNVVRCPRRIARRSVEGAGLPRVA
jgi:hypothetical protein